VVKVVHAKTCEKSVPSILGLREYVFVILVFISLFTPLWDGISVVYRHVGMVSMVYRIHQQFRGSSSAATNSQLVPLFIFGG
jgi:hypothetical protein